MKLSKDGIVSGDLSLELVPVVEAGAPVLALPQPEAGEVAFGGLLSDALFGEVIDISDLIPQVLTSAAGASQVSPVEAAGSGWADGGDILAAASNAETLTILYDDGILASDGTIL